MNSFIVGGVKVKLMTIQLFFDNIDISIIFTEGMIETVEIYTSVIKSVRPSLIVPGRIQPKDMKKIQNYLKTNLVNGFRTFTTRKYELRDF